MNKQLAVFLDGYGGSGKSTLAPRLGRKLAGLGYKVCHVVLPAYGTPTGVFIQSILKGDEESYKNIPKDSLRLLFALNRAEIREYLRAGMDHGWSFVIERSIASNALSIPEALGLDVEQLTRLKKYFPEQFRGILEGEVGLLNQLDREFEFTFEGLRTVKIFLGVDEETALISRETRGGAAMMEDLFEDRREIGTRNKLFRDMIETQGGWVVVPRTGGVNETLSFVWETIKKEAKIIDEAKSEGGWEIDFDELLKEYYPEHELQEIRRAVFGIWATNEGLKNSEWGRLDPDHELSLRLQFFPNRVERF